MQFVTVVMPNFNNGPYLKRWAEPLITDPSVGEIIVYDNHSTDGSVELLESLGSPKIMVIRGSENLGATLARHEAMRHARGELICFIDGDDWLEDKAIEKAAQALANLDLDFALFQCFDVDLDGNNPVVTTPTPNYSIDGRTACALTMGGWNICGWGVFRRKVYQNAWAGFEPHGFHDDEVLIRRMFLASRLVGPSTGRMFYRRVPKKYGAEQTINWGRSNVLALALAIDARLDSAAIGRQLRHTVRFMFGITRRALAGEYPRAAVARALEEYFALSPPWRLTDAAWYAVDRLLRAAHPLLSR